MRGNRTTRRGFLVAGSSVALAFAGCLGNGGSGGESLPTPTMGADDADVVVAAWEDFSCSHCSNFNANVLPEIVSNYVEPGSVRFEHHDFPIPLNEWSWNTALAARSVQAQAGQEAFFTFSERAFENYADMDWETVRSLADEAGADPETTVSEARNDTYRPTVEDDRRDGRDRGVTGTPGVFVDGQAIEGYAYDRISSAIESALP